MLWSLAVAGLAVHVVFFYSIFEIYFTSPLVHGMTPVTADISASPARRLVLFVMDGLRADKLLELDAAGKTRAPFLRDVITKLGAWGVSHTRVPTESRPGHVALIAGFYEDVGAIAKGWKDNPVDFDSVFNESRYTWSWGSPDILPMFAKGASGDHVMTYTYPAEHEDFGSSDSSKLDTWVFDRVKAFLSEASANEQLRSKLKQDKIVLFLHLLGLDTNGHAHKPYSNEYLGNIAIADSGIRQISKLVDEFYEHDGATAYIVSSDHGMTNWGSHGAGHASETLTPLIVWGAGIRGPRYGLGLNERYEDGLHNEWDLSAIERSDINQADLCPLMSLLIGVPFPVNSVGVLPLSYLNVSERDKAEAIFANSLQMLAQFQVKMREKRETTLALLFTPFKHLTLSIQADKVQQVLTLLDDGRYSEAISRSQSLIKLALEALNYYHHYDRFFLGLSITLGFLGWITYVFSLVLQHTAIPQPPRVDSDHVSFWCSPKGGRLLAVSAGSVVALLIYVQSLPWTHNIYCLLPIILWHKVSQKAGLLRDFGWYVKDHGYVRRTLCMCVIGICGLEIIVLSFFYRQLLSVGLLFLSVWPCLTHLRHTDKPLLVSWILSCLLLAIFPLLPVVGRNANYNLVTLSGILGVAVALYLACRPETSIFSSVGTGLPCGDRRSVRLLTLCQLILMLLAVYIVWSTSLSLEQKQGLPLHNQILSWLILVSSLISPLLSAVRAYTRLLNIGLAFMPAYLLLSTAYEGLFYMTLCALLIVWLQVAYKLQPRKAQKLSEVEFSSSINLASSERHLVMADLQTAYIFVYLLITAFFGTGNIASVNSFDPSFVYCFITVFSPFTMASLIVWKLVTPFLLVTCVFMAIQRCVNVPMHSLFLIVLLMSDYMALHFFFLVQDYGSWLDIGTSISHYVIVMSLICFLFGLVSLSRVLTGCRLHVFTKHHRS